MDALAHLRQIRDDLELGFEHVGGLAAFTDRLRGRVEHLEGSLEATIEGRVSAEVDTLRKEFEDQLGSFKEAVVSEVKTLLEPFEKLLDVPDVERTAGDPSSLDKLGQAIAALDNPGGLAAMGTGTHAEEPEAAPVGEEGRGDAV